LYYLPVMGILREKTDKPDSLYMSYQFTEEDYEITRDGFATLPPPEDFQLIEHNYGKNSKIRLLEHADFFDKNFFEDFTNMFDDEVYKI